MYLELSSYGNFTILRWHFITKSSQSLPSRIYSFIMFVLISIRPSLMWEEPRFASEGTSSLISVIAAKGGVEETPPES